MNIKKSKFIQEEKGTLCMCHDLSDLSVQSCCVQTFINVWGLHLPLSSKTTLLENLSFMHPLVVNSLTLSPTGMIPGGTPTLLGQKKGQDSNFLYKSSKTYKIIHNNIKIKYHNPSFLFLFIGSSTPSFLAYYGGTQGMKI